MESASVSTVIHPALGIDLGYHSTKVSHSRASDEIASVSFESLAPVVDGESVAAPGSKMLDGICVEVGGLTYFVGQDAHVRMKSSKVRTVMDDYSATPEYLAIFRGALFYAARQALSAHPGATKLEVQQLVCGLPVAALSARKETVRALAKGTHVLPSIPGARGPIEVTVKKVAVVAQPQGTLTYFGSKYEDEDFLGGKNLVCDLGGGTFDWFTSTNNKASLENSGSHKSGMLTIANRVADKIATGLRADTDSLKKIDKAIRDEAEEIRFGNKVIKMDQFEPIIEAALNESINSMMDQLQLLDSYDNVVVTGGGGSLLHKVMSKRFGESIKVCSDEEPVYSNSRGFFLLAEWLNHGKTQG